MNELTPEPMWWGGISQVIVIHRDDLNVQIKQVFIKVIVVLVYCLVYYLGLSLGKYLERCGI